jgi:hypothetical protein
MLSAKRGLGALFMAALLLSGCSKDPGPGGQATITGKIHAKDYNSNGTILLGEYDAPDEDVYIIYGDEPTYGDHVKTGPDGIYRFQFLNKGKYRVYVYSKDFTTVSGKEAIYSDVEITDKKQTVTVPDIVIQK